MRNIDGDFNSFVGRRFEEISKEFLINLNEKNKIDIKIDSIGNWWGAKRVNEEREEIEIDLVAIGEPNKILFVECKWKDDINAEEIVKLCEERARFVEYKNKDRKESYAVIAKSFKKRISEFNGKKVYCFDLKDMEKELQK
jgi:hypothetical protein